MKLTCCTVSICLYYSTSFHNNDSSSLRITDQGLARLRLRNHGHAKFKTNTSQLIVRIYKLSHNALSTNSRVMKVKHGLLRILLQAKQSKTSVTTIKLFSLESTREAGKVVHSGKTWRETLWLNATHSGKN